MLQRFLKDSRAAALMEFVLIMPVLFLFLFGAIEISHYILIAQRVEKSGYVLGDTLSQFAPNELTKAQVTSLFGQYATEMDPYNDDTRQRVIFTSVSKDPADHKIKINWQVVGGGTYSDDLVRSIVDDKLADSITATSPAPGTVASWSNNSDIETQVASMWDGENMIVTEVFYRYNPLVTSLLNTTLPTAAFKFNAATLVRRTYFRPRNGDLTTAPD